MVQCRALTVSEEFATESAYQVRCTSYEDPTALLAGRPRFETQSIVMQVALPSPPTPTLYHDDVYSYYQIAHIWYTNPL